MGSPLYIYYARNDPNNLQSEGQEFSVSNEQIKNAERYSGLDKFWGVTWAGVDSSEYCRHMESGFCYEG